MIIQCICAFTGALGFGILFNIRGKNLFFAALGGSLSWTLFLIAAPLVPMDIGQYFIAAAFASLFSECMAIIRRVPVTIFLVTSMIPLVPGGVIFYTMQNLILGKTRLAAHMGIYAFEIAGSIALGILMMSFVIRTLKQFIRKHKHKTR